MPYQSVQVYRRHTDPIVGSGSSAVIRTQSPNGEPLYEYPQRVKPVNGFFLGRTEVTLFHSQTFENFVRCLVGSDLGWIDASQFTFEETKKDMTRVQEQSKDVTNDNVTEVDGERYQLNPQGVQPQVIKLDEPHTAPVVEAPKRTKRK